MMVVVYTKEYFYSNVICRDTEGGLASHPEYFNFSIVTFDGFPNEIIIACIAMGCVNQQMLQRNAVFYAEN